jgi:hypothetical protein
MFQFIGRGIKNWSRMEVTMHGYEISAPKDQRHKNKKMAA